MIGFNLTWGPQGILDLEIRIHGMHTMGIDLRECLGGGFLSQILSNVLETRPTSVFLDHVTDEV